MATTKRARAKKVPEPASETPSNPVDSGSPAVADGGQSSDVQEFIRQRAYEIYQHRGGQNGTDIEDWIAAEKEITGRSGRRRS